MSKKDKEVPTPAPEDKVQVALAAIRKKHPNAGIDLYGSHSNDVVETIPTGSLRLDSALGCGGWARGRVSEIYGQESSGKTTLSIHAIASAQKMGLVAAFIDLEHAFDIQYAKSLGVDVTKLVFMQPNSGEEALQVNEELCSSNAIGLVVLDSVAALVPQAELDGETGSGQPGLHARLMSQHCRKLCGLASKSGTHVMFLNQMRMKIGIVYGNPNVTTGGNALKFYASQRVSIKRGSEKIMNGAKHIGNTHEAQVVKNKLAPPWEVATMDIVWGRGVDKYSDLRDVAIEKGVLTTPGGGSYYIGSKLIVRGLQKLRETIETDLDLQKELSTALAAKGLHWHG